MNKNKKVVGMFSGGLDSILATKIMHNEGFEIIALHFYTGFNGKLSHEIPNGPNWKWTASEPVLSSAEKLGVELISMDVSKEYLDLIKNPKYSYGSGINPCIDCRILLLKKARETMEKEQAILVFTGEVIGQRPMSQHKPTLKLVEKKAGLEGVILRPLSAKLLEPTIPEKEGMVNRENLYGFNGRSRKPQQKLAKEFGIISYPQPAGGCILTEKSFRRKYLDLKNHLKGDGITLYDLNSLKAGRHLRLSSGTKVIVGRDETENQYLEELFVGKYWLFDAKDFPCAAVFSMDEPSEEDFRKIASICARYSKGLNEEMVVILATKGNETREFIVKPIDHMEIESLLIH